MFGDIDHILISSARVGVHNKTDHGKAIPVNKGEIVEGRIIRPIPPHHALIQIKGRQLLARTSVPLNPGNIAFFKVEQCSPQCILKLLEVRPGGQAAVEGLLKGGAFSGFPFKFLTDVLGPQMASLEKSGEDVPHVLRQMWGLLRGISLGSHEVVRPELLRSFVDGSGMSWEHKLSLLALSGLQSSDQAKAIIDQDLKGLALKLLAGGGAQGLSNEEAIIRFADGLEQIQLLNVSGLEEKGRLFFVIPMQWHDGFAFAQLLIDLGKRQAGGAKGKDEDGVLKLSLFLEMSYLGPVRVDASVFKRQIRVSFLVSNREIEGLIRYCAPRLKEQLERHGFSLEQVTCRSEEHSNLVNTCLLDALIDSDEHYINVVV